MRGRTQRQIEADDALLAAKRALLIADSDLEHVLFCYREILARVDKEKDRRERASHHLATCHTQWTEAYADYGKDDNG